MTEKEKKIPPRTKEELNDPSFKGCGHSGDFCSCAECQWWIDQDGGMCNAPD